jgi:1-deoxy-D-xylulose-5-phosphate reductoisomerase
MERRRTGVCGHYPRNRCDRRERKPRYNQKSVRVLLPMSHAQKNVAVLGSTGSIGMNAIEVIEGSKGRLNACALSAHGKLECLLEQARRLKPRWIVATDEKAAGAFSWKGLPAGTELFVGAAGLAQVVAQDDVDVVLAAIVGSAGLRGTWAALEAKKTVALANKESLVMAGPLVMDLAQKQGASILPVDSEHSAIFQALRAGQPAEVRRIVLTASGGPFRTLHPDALKQVTVHDALSHPTWQMGPKITVDSATLMNKALEIIESRWLFQVEPDQIEVVIHPQSIVHSLVEFVDGSTIAQMGPPDMKLPIQYALEYPHRRNGIALRMNWREPMHLDFEPPDEDRFPALKLGKTCAQAGGTSGAVLNAANEAAVASFLAGELHFTEIVPACRSVLGEHPYETNPTLERLFELDAWARREIAHWVCA